MQNILKTTDKKYFSTIVKGHLSNIHNESLQEICSYCIYLA